MIVSLNRKSNPIEFNLHRKQLLRYIEDYKLNLDIKSNEFSTKAFEKTKRILAYYYDPNNLELTKDYKKIKDTVGDKTRLITNTYLKRIMLILGNIAECIIIDNCKKNQDLNMKCINYACFKNDINEWYDDIEYNKYTPFSPSHKRIVYYSDGGLIYYKDNLYVYEPNHINKDIVWCEKNQMESILNATIPYTKYKSMARLQVKTSTNHCNIKWNDDKYKFSPIIYFDLNRDINKLYDCLYKTKNTKLYVRSVLDFDFSLMEECMWYFKLLIGYFSGLIDLKKEIKLDELSIMNKGMTKYIFNSDIKSLLSDDSVVHSNKLLTSLQDTILNANQHNNKIYININGA